MTPLRMIGTAPWPRIMWPPSAATTPRGVGWSARAAISPLGRPNAAEATALPSGIGARPDRVVHALKRHQPAASVADRGTDPDVQLLGFSQSAPKDAIGFFQGETHRLFSSP